MEAKKSQPADCTNLQRTKTITIALAVTGIVLFVTGITLFGTVQINSLTGQTSQPYLIPGVLLTLVGIGTSISAARYRKQQQRSALATRAREIGNQTTMTSPKSVGR